MPRCSRPFLKVLALKFLGQKIQVTRRNNRERRIPKRLCRENWEDLIAKLKATAKKLLPVACSWWSLISGATSSRKKSSWQTDTGSDAGRKLGLTVPKKWVGWDKALPVTFTKKGFVCCCTKALRIVPAWDIPQWLQRARINFTRINYFDNTSELFQQKENKWSTKE